jgi:5-methylcytosine-specific restriction endonuclease McrA
MTPRAYAKHRGVSHAAVYMAVREGRISTAPDGRIDPVAADRDWARSTRPVRRAKTLEIGGFGPETRPEWWPAADDGTPLGRFTAYALQNPRAYALAKVGLPVVASRNGLRFVDEREVSAWIKEYDERRRSATPGVKPMPAQKTCSVCAALKPISEFATYLHKTGTRVARAMCKCCHADRYGKQSKKQAAAIAALREISENAKTCIRCNTEKPRPAFDEGDRTCFKCRVEILSDEISRLRERASLISDEDWSRKLRTISKYSDPERNMRAANEREARRKDRMIQQSDGTVTKQAIGGLFGEAEGKDCPYCGAEMNRANGSLDHIVPLCLGGAHGLRNLLICCLDCNTKKGRSSFALWLSRLAEPFRGNAASVFADRFGELAA